MSSNSSTYLGIDFGTSGCRATVIDKEDHILYESRIDFTHQQIASPDAEQWKIALQHLLQDISSHHDVSSIKRIACDATSGTVLLVDRDGQPVTAPVMYYDKGTPEAHQSLQRYLPPQSRIAEQYPTLIRLLTLTNQFDSDFRIVHQADYISGLLTLNWDLSDYHNCLKLGFRPDTMDWHADLDRLATLTPFPEVKIPGTAISTIECDWALRMGYSNQTEICAATTDSNAAFLASNAQKTGEAVTSLGSTLVIKQLVDQEIADPGCGVYSHRMGDLWVAGGASNTGGAVLNRYFDRPRLKQLTKKLDFSRPTGLEYYPLPETGERFPIADANKKPVLEPRPEQDHRFFQAILESLTRIEKQGYEKLQSLGASSLSSVETCGGGSHNRPWTRHRENRLQVEVKVSRHTEASFGSARLAKQGLKRFSLE